MSIIYRKELEQCRSKLILYSHDLLHEYEQLDEFNPDNQARLLYLEGRIQKVRILTNYVISILRSGHEIYMPNNLMKAIMNGLPLIAAIVLSGIGLIDTDQDVLRFIDLYTKRLARLKIFQSDEAYFKFNNEEYKALIAVIEFSENPHYQSRTQAHAFMLNRSLIDQFLMLKTNNPKK